MSLKTYLVASIGFALLCTAVNAQDKGPFGADRHVAKGVACTVCHGKDMNNIEYPDETTCVKCHPKAPLVEKPKSSHPTHMLHRITANVRFVICSMKLLSTTAINATNLISGKFPKNSPEKKVLSR